MHANPFRTASPFEPHIVPMPRMSIGDRYPPTQPTKVYLKNAHSFEYEVTVERYDDAGHAVVLRKSARAVDMPYEEMRAAGLRFGNTMVSK